MNFRRTVSLLAAAVRLGPAALLATKPAEPLPRPAEVLAGLRSLAITASDLVRGVYAPVHCDSCKRTRARISRAEVPVLVEEHELPCPCGQVQVYVGGAGLAEAVAR